MKKICLMTLALVVLMVTGCGKKHSKENLMEKMPADVVAASVWDVKDVLESFGCEIKDNKVSVPNVLSKLYQDRDIKEFVSVLEDGESGIEMSYVGMFVTKDLSSYMVGYLSDKKKFESFIEDKTEKKFKEDGKFKYIEEDEACIAFDGDMWWFAFGEEDSHQLKKIKSFYDLKENLAETEVGKEMLKADGDLMALVNMKMLNRVADGEFGELLAMSSIAFDDFSYLLGNVELKENTLEATLRFLNSKGQDAKTAFPLGSINPATIKKLGVNNANALFAVALSPEAIDKISEIMERFGVDRETIGLVKSLSGTIASVSCNEENVAAVIDSKDYTYDEIMGYFLYDNFRGGDGYRDGNRIIWKKSNDQAFKGGQLNVNKMADEFENHFMGLAIANIGGILTNGTAKTNDLTYLTIGSTKGNTLEIKLTSAFKNGDHYFESLIKEVISLKAFEDMFTGFGYGRSTYYEDTMGYYDSYGDYYYGDTVAYDDYGYGYDYDYGYPAEEPAAVEEEYYYGY